MNSLMQLCIFSMSPKHYIYNKLIYQHSHRFTIKVLLRSIAVVAMCLITYITISCLWMIVLNCIFVFLGLIIRQTFFEPLHEEEFYDDSNIFNMPDREMISQVGDNTQKSIRSSKPDLCTRF